MTKFKGFNLETLAGFANVLHCKYRKLHYYSPALNIYQVKTKTFYKAINSLIPVKMALIFTVPPAAKTSSSIEVSIDT